MILLPLIERELRVASRHRSTYWLRVLGAAVVVFTLFQVFDPNQTGSARTTLSIFRGLNLILASLIWLIAPVMTADCLSREKREGTLPLLFLTALRPFEVVVAKGVIHFIRAGLLLLAAIPALMIPIMVGGITAMDVLRVLLLHAASLGLALAAGVVASALCRHWVTARVLAIGLTLLNGLALITLHLSVRATWRWKVGVQTGARQPWNAILIGEFQSFAHRLNYGFWRDWGIPPTYGIIVLMAVLVLLGSALLVVFTLWLGGRAIERTWREDPNRRTGGAFWQFLTRPRLGLSRWWQRRRALGNGNPIHWLYTGTREARGHRFLWMLGVVGLIAWSGFEQHTHFIGVATLGLMVAMALAACGSFSQELESGAFELLLVSPITPRQIIVGRLRGLLWSFLPAAGVVAALAGSSEAINGWAEPGFGSLVRGLLMVGLVLGIEIVVLGVMGMVGVAFSFSGFPFVGAAALALLLMVGLPMPMWVAALRVGATGSYWPLVVGLIYASFLVVNFWRSWNFAHRQLELRRFLAGAEAEAASPESPLATVPSAS